MSTAGFINTVSHNVGQAHGLCINIF